MSSFEVKGRIAPCTLFRLLTTDLAVLAGDVEKRLSETPEFFRNMAVIIDCSALGEKRDGLDLSGLVRLLRERAMTPVGIQGVGELHERQAAGLHLGVFPEGRQPAAKGGAASVSAPAQEAQAMVVDKPVRSGQQVYARGRDLVVLAPVGQGAEVIADGNIHIYAPLRGRALAGAMGFEGARIFCRELRAELVSVAGLYRVSEDLPENLCGATVQVRLNGRQLVIEPL
jgi:septum site-determining protein MinC